MSQFAFTSAQMQSAFWDRANSFQPSYFVRLDRPVLPPPLEQLHHETDTYVELFCRSVT